jgi:4-alpha-glucanotransferase
MAANGFSWWIERLKQTFAGADIVRIDHFRGFAACFQIPVDSPDATEGEWVDAPGAALFDAVSAALGKLDIVAEDLGTITPDVVLLRQRLGLPGMRILQFGFSEDASHDYLPHNYANDTVAYTGTHDNDTACGWWRSTSARERHFAGSYLSATDQDIHWTMIRALTTSVATTVIFPLQDVLGLDSHHRMNVPGTPTGNWAWRFTWPMIGDEATRILGLMTAASGRGAFGLLRLPT